MDNQSSQSDKQIQHNCSQTKKPLNRNKFVFKNIVISSQFPGGNIKTAQFQQQYRPSGRKALTVQFWGNSDAQIDPIDKCWFYFSITGIKALENKSGQINYEEIIFRFKNANVYRKFVKQKRYKPYIVYKQSNQQNKTKQTGTKTQRQMPASQPQLLSINPIINYWQTLYLSQINILQNFIIQAQFVYSVKPNMNVVHFAYNLPYNISHLDKLHENINKHIQANNQNHDIKQQNALNKKINKIYYHRQIIAQSVDEYPIYMCTITSSSNILTIKQKQPQIIANGCMNNLNCKSQRPYLLKNRPQIVITSRVHPSETSSSFCVEGIIESLMKNPDFQFLTNIFIFRIVPMVNPDGVQNGHYRLDNYLQNLNRFYGHSDPIKTPSVYVLQKIITQLRQKSKLFFFLDIHGHNSPKPSFIFGNFCQNFYQTLQNKTFVKVMQSLSEGYFDALCCQFSERHMTIKQKYDQHSKQASARVFAYRGSNNIIQQNSQNQTSINAGTNNNLNQINAENKNQVVLPAQKQKQKLFVEHSYTLQLHPYIIIQNNIRKSVVKRQNTITNSYKNLPKSNNNTIINNNNINNINSNSNNSNNNTINNNINSSNSNITNNANSNSNTRRSQQLVNVNQSQGSEIQIIEQYKKIGQNILYSIQQILGININIKINNIINSNTNSSLSNNINTNTCSNRSSLVRNQIEINQDCLVIRRRIFKQIAKLVEYYERSKKSKSKQINKQLFQRYYHKLGIFQIYRQYINNNNNNISNNLILIGNPLVTLQIKQQLKQCPIHFLYQEWVAKKDKMQQLNAKRIKYMKQRSNNQQLNYNNRNKSENNNLGTNQVQNKNEQKYKQYLEYEDKQQEQQHSIEKYQTIIYSKSNTRDIEKPLEKQHTSKNSKGIKNIQFDLMKKIQNRPLRQQISSNNYQYGISTIVNTNKNNNTNSNIHTNMPTSLQKKSNIINAHLSDIQSLEKKIRKLMFRHRTENQIIQFDEEGEESRNNTNNINNAQTNNNSSNNVGPLGITYVPDFRQQQESQACKYAKRNYKQKPKDKDKNKDKQKQLQRQKYTINQNKLEPLTKNKKTKIIHLKTEQSKRSNNLIGNYNYYNYNQPYEFNDKCILQKVENRGQLSENRKLDTLDGLQPRIQQFVKKISIQKYEESSTTSEKNGRSSLKQSQKQCTFLQVKASNMSNISITRRKKSITRVSQQREKQKLIILKQDEAKPHSINTINTGSRYSSHNTNIMSTSSNKDQCNVYQTYIYQASISQQAIFSNINFNNNNGFGSFQEKQLNAALFRQKLNGLHSNVNGTNIYNIHKNKFRNLDAYPTNLNLKKDSCKDNNEEVISENLKNNNNNGNNSISKSFRVLAIQQTKRAEIVQKSKKIFVEKKKQQKQEQLAFPSINYNSNTITDSG